MTQNTLTSLPKCFTIAAAAALALSACGGGSSTSVSMPIAATFLDAAVEGLSYSAASSAPASTNSAGQFPCMAGESVSFSVGGLALGSAACAPFITPQTLAANASIASDAVVNRLLTLQVLDEDADPSNGIKIAASVKTALAGRTMDFSAPVASFTGALTTTLATLPEPYKSRAAGAGQRALAREHFEDTLAAKVGTPFNEVVTQTNTLGTVTATITRYTVQAASSFFIPYEGSVQKVKDEFSKGFLPAYGSGLAFKDKLADGTLEFYAITDRGPNGDGPKIPNTGGTICQVRADNTCDAKFFPSPAFAPSIGVITVGKDGAVLKSSLPIRVDSTLKSNGFPSGLNKLGASGEAPLTDAYKYEPSTTTNFSLVGLDTESVVVDKARNALWISDEYGPFIVKIDPVTGNILKKYGPAIASGSTVTAGADTTAVLPAVLAKRRANRGMEGLTLDVASGKLHGFLQSPLTDLSAAGAPATGTYVAPTGSGCSDAGTGKRVERYARFTRWVEFDPTTETSKMYAYPINCADYDANRTGNAKLGDMVSVGNGKFIVIEQGAGTNGKVFNRLMLVEITAGTTDIAAAAFNPTTSDLEKSSMAGASVNGVTNYANVTTLKKTLLLDLNAAGWIAEKAEGLALVDGNTLALVNDNDFGMRTAVYDASGAAIDGADITACLSTNGVLSACGNGVSTRVTRGTDMERPNRLWLIKFGKNLLDF